MSGRTLIPATRAGHTARFLPEQLLPLFEAAGWPIQRVLTDHGSECKGGFGQACCQPGIRHRRIRPRHAWTNGFLERLQGTILHESTGGSPSEEVTSPLAGNSRAP